MLQWLFDKFHSTNPAEFAPQPNILLADFSGLKPFTSVLDLNPTLRDEQDLPPEYLRDADRHRGQTLNAIARLPECQTAINYWCDATIASKDGDDRGIAVADSIDRKNNIPIDPQIEELVTETIDRLFPERQVRFIAENLLVNGDDFYAAIVAKNGKQIDRLQQLPCWQTFRREPPGQPVEGFYVRDTRNIDSSVRYDPRNTFHWRFRPIGKYGRALFEYSERDAQTLLKRLQDLDRAARSMAIDPLVHEMPPCSDEKYRADYKTAYLEEQQRRLITDFYVAPGQKIYRASGGNVPDLSSIASCVEAAQLRLVLASQVPFFLLGLNTKGAKEISGEPTVAFERAIQTFRAELSEEIRRTIELELTLKGIPRERQKFRLIYPKITVNPYAIPAESDESDNITDTEK
jgi:hypothetical protein